MPRSLFSDVRWGLAMRKARHSWEGQRLADPGLRLQAALCPPTSPPHLSAPLIRPLCLSKHCQRVWTWNCPEQLQRVSQRLGGGLYIKPFDLERKLIFVLVLTSKIHSLCPP